MEKISKLKRIISSCLAAVSLATVGITAIATNGFKTFGKNENVQIELPEENNGGAILDTESGKNPAVSLTAVRLASTEYEEYGVSPLADSAYTLTATITPEGALNQKVDWSVSFKDASSEWATGKTVTNYVTVTPTSDGALTATVACKAAFGEQIIVTAASREDTSIKATCTVDYAKKIGGISSLVIGGSNNITPSDNKITLDSSTVTNGYFTMSYDMDLTVTTIRPTFIYSPYTIDDEFTTRFLIASTSYWTETLRSAFQNQSSITTNISSTITTTPEQVLTSERPRFFLGRYAGVNVLTGTNVSSTVTSMRNSSSLTATYLTALKTHKANFPNYPILYFYVQATGSRSNFTSSYYFMLDTSTASASAASAVNVTSVPVNKIGC